jgi:cysteine-rich repeat protein
LISPYCNNCSLEIYNIIECINCTDGYALIDGNCSGVCGNGFLTSDEQCDDGNKYNGDGCSSVCVIESGFYCPTVNSSCFLCL